MLDPAGWVTEHLRVRGKGFTRSQKSWASVHERLASGERRKQPRESAFTFVFLCLPLFTFIVLYFLLPVNQFITLLQCVDARKLTTHPAGGTRNGPTDLAEIFRNLLLWVGKGPGFVFHLDSCWLRALGRRNIGDGCHRFGHNWHNWHKGVCLRDVCCSSCRLTTGGGYCQEPT